MHLSAHNKAVVALIIANIIWGAAAPIFKWALADIQPFTLAFLRFGLGGLLLLPFTYDNLAIKKSDLSALFLLTIAGITVNISFLFLSLPLTDSINVPIIASAGPVFLIIGGMFFLKEHTKAKVIAGTIMSLVGVAVIVAYPLFQNGGIPWVQHETAFLGNIFLIIATIASVIHTLVLRKISPRYSAETLTFWSFAIGAMTFLPMLLYEMQQNAFLTGLTYRGATGILFGAIFSSALAYYLYNFALKNMIASEAGIFVYIDPVVAVMIAVPLLGEVITLPYVVGSFLVFLGIFIAEGRLPYHPLHKLRR